jgi:hypothetical protein
VKKVAGSARTAIGLRVKDELQELRASVSEDGKPAIGKFIVISREGWY